VHGNIASVGVSMGWKSDAEASRSDADCCSEDAEDEEKMTGLSQPL
jgi:hypothetical protein